jgi:DNA-directed RNA polymerase specialized sigma24 family protein
MMISNAIREEVYGEVKDMLYQICHRQTNCCRCYIEDRMSTACLAYAKAYHDFDPARGNAFTTVVWTYVRNALMAECRACAHRSWLTYNTDGIRDAVVPKASPFWDRVDELSEDARSVMRICLDLPEDLDAMLIKCSDKRGLIRAYLSGMGWTMKRVTEAFSEIGSIL